MQEEVENRTLTLVVSGTKFTGRLLKAAISKYMAHCKEKKLQKQRSRDAPVTPHGKQTVKQLIGQNQGISNIEITDPSIKEFEKIARKYGVDYAVKKDRSSSPPKYLIFFKGRDADVNKEKQRELYTSPQVEIVRDIHKRLISNLQERPTIEELSKEYLINTATLKDTFKGVYGQPIGTYMKVYRMKQAAALLRQTQATIAEIASQVGYENQSKFATAFRDVMKIAPAEYRKQNSGD